MELKLVKDKIMAGSFSVVEVYLEGLKPRIEREWEKIGKKPKKKELELLAESEINKSVCEARKEREKWDKNSRIRPGIKRSRRGIWYNSSRAS
jgi:hypothetical protein